MSGDFSLKYSQECVVMVACCNETLRHLRSTHIYLAYQACSCLHFSRAKSDLCQFVKSQQPVRLIQGFRNPGGTMESESARRRMHQIACHIAGNKDVGGAFLFPMNCSNTMSSVIKRYDNMVLFARQGAASQGYFMRQVTVQQFPGLSNGGTSHLDTPLECSGKVSAACGNKASAALTGQDPLFGKPVELRQGTAGALEIRQQQQQNMQSIARPPLFAKPAGGSNNLKDTIVVEGHLTGQRMNNFHGLEWSPRMDVAESDSAYVVTIELPGVSDSTIRVEVNDKSLIVTGTRSTEWWRDGNGKSISTPVYHRQELSQGPYRVVWQLPDNSNKDEVSAEFVDGFLQITILKRDQ